MPFVLVIVAKFGLSKLSFRCSVFNNIDWQGFIKPNLSFWVSEINANLLHNATEIQPDMPLCVHCVADTYWSVHIKCCFHQKKTKSKRPTTRIRRAERQHKGRDQSNTKNVKSKTPRLHSVAKQHKVSDRSVWNPKSNCIQTKSNKIWFRKAKSEERRKEANRAEEDLKRWCHGKKQKTFH